MRRAIARTVDVLPVPVKNEIGKVSGPSIQMEDAIHREVRRRGGGVVDLF